MVAQQLLKQFCFLALGSSLMGQTSPPEKFPTPTLQQETKVLVPSRIGEKQANPYTLENMQKAYTTLYNDGKQLEATHTYMRFLPKTAEELQELNQQFNGLVFDYPLEYKYIQGDLPYHDPTLPKDQITWQYVVVPKGQNLPNIKNEFLDLAYIPRGKYKDDNLLEHAYRQLYPDTDPKIPVAEKSVKRSGFIMVWDNTLKQAIPLRDLYVRIGHWWTWEVVRTDQNGMFRSTERWNNSTDLDIKFESSVADIRVALIDINGAHNRRIFSDNLPVSSTTVLYPSPAPIWKVAITWTALYDYLDYCAADGIRPFPNNLKVWVRERASGGGACPMFNKGDFTITQLSTLGVIGLVAREVIPDLIINVISPEAMTIKRITYHELTHASHYAQVGNELWNRIIWGEVRNMIDHNNDPYFHCQGHEGELIRLAESYASYREEILTNRKYGTNWDLDRLENRCIYGDPTNPNADDRFIPHLFHDLADNRADYDTVPRPNTCLIQDASDFPLASQRVLFEGLTSNVDNFSRYKTYIGDRVFPITGSIDWGGPSFWTALFRDIWINRLFQSYGY